MLSNCPNCGMDVARSTARFCDQCGVELITVVDEATRKSPLVADQPEGTMVAADLNPEDITRFVTPPSPRSQNEKVAPQPAENKTKDFRPGRTRRDSGQAVTSSEKTAPQIKLPKGIDITGVLIHQRYQVLKTLGKGGFGAVYLAQDMKLGRLCVVKQMLPKQKSPQKMERDRANFEREAKLLVQLNQPGHPNIPEIYDHFFEDKGNYVVMKYIEGRSLQQILQQSETPLPLEDVIRHTVDLCSALHYMHTYFDEPVMHRDIKPSNVLLGDDGRIWLVDFGLAKAVPVDDSDDMTVTQGGGSVGYTPLEQWLGEAVPASDIYALGATMHYVLTGIDPLKNYGDEVNIVKLQQMHSQFIPIRKINKDLPEALEGIVISAIGADPDQRPTARQVQEQLNVFISGAKDTPVFTFKTGESAKTKGQLVDLCDDHKGEAEGYLYRGDFERWFRLTNRNDLADAATQAVKRAKSQRDGLEKFLKLVLPNLFLRRLSRAALHVARGSVQFVLTAIVVIALLAIGGSYIARLVIWQVVGNAGAQNAPPVEIGQVNRYTEADLETYAGDQIGAILDNIRVDLQPPNHLDFSATWGGVFLLELPFTVERGDDNNLQFQLDQINGFSLYLISDNIAQGLNDGIDSAFRRAPAQITSLDIKDTAALVEVEGNERWQPTPTPPGPTPTATSAPVESVLLAVFNEFDHDIIFEINGEASSIAARDTKAINLPPGTYNYTVRTADGQHLLGQGEKTWTNSVYELRIGLETSQAMDAEN